MNYRGYTIPSTKESILELDSRVNPGASALMWQDDKYGSYAVATCVTVVEMKSSIDPTELINKYTSDVQRIIDFSEDGTQNQTN